MKAPITAQQLRDQYAKNATQLGGMVKAARIATNFGKGGDKGKRYNGYFYHQLVQMHSAALASATATDAALAPMLAILNTTEV